jgi:hypothetical protein
MCTYLLCAGIVTSNDDDVNDAHYAFELHNGVTSRNSARDRPSLSIDHATIADVGHGVPFSPKVDDPTAALL